MSQATATQRKATTPDVQTAYTFCVNPGYTPSIIIAENDGAIELRMSYSATLNHKTTLEKLTRKAADTLTPWAIASEGLKIGLFERHSAPIASEFELQAIQDNKVVASAEWGGEFDKRKAASRTFTRNVAEHLKARVANLKPQQ